MKRVIGKRFTSINLNDLFFPDRTAGYAMYLSEVAGRRLKEELELRQSSVALNRLSHHAVHFSRLADCRHLIGTRHEVIGDQEFLLRSWNERSNNFANTRLLEILSEQFQEESFDITFLHAVFSMLHSLREYSVTPSLINPSGDGSLLFEFFVKSDFFLVEFYYSGEIIYLRRLENQPKIVSEIRIEDFDKIAEEIAHAYARANV